MQTVLHDINGRFVLEIIRWSPGVIASERDAVDLVGLCGENATDRLLLHAEALSPDFFDLSTRLAGEILLKFSNYSIRAALVANEEQTSHGKFPDFMLETNRGSDFRVFAAPGSALEWLSQP